MGKGYFEAENLLEGREEGVSELIQPGLLLIVLTRALFRLVHNQQKLLQNINIVQQLHKMENRILYSLI